MTFPVNSSSGANGIYSSSSSGATNPGTGNGLGKTELLQLIAKIMEKSGQNAKNSLDKAEKSMGDEKGNASKTAMIEANMAMSTDQAISQGCTNLGNTYGQILTAAARKG